MVDIVNKADAVMAKLKQDIESKKSGKEPAGIQPAGSNPVQSDMNKEIKALITEMPSIRLTDVQPKPSILADKLKQRVETMRIAKAEDEEIIELTHENEIALSVLILNSKTKDNRMGGKTRGVDGIYHDIVFYFKNGICKVESELFIDPFFITVYPDDGKNLKGHVFTVKEFYLILRILTQFDGRISLT